jgi:hypothetical protein
MTWAAGEPAVLQHWVTGAACGRSTAALQAEERASQDFVFLSLSALFEARGAEAYRLKRIPVLWADDVATEQCAVRRRGPLPPSDPQEWEAFDFDRMDGRLASAFGSE